MSPATYAAGRVTVHHGDSLRVLPGLPDASVDAVTTDPPYELGFMGRAWDASGIAYRVDLWEEVLRVLKPGGHLLAFGGTRTWHRLTCAVEDAGFEIRDTITWLYGSGFPKSLDVGKAIDKAAGAEREVIGYRSRPDGSSRHYDEWSTAAGAGATIAREGGDWRPTPDTAPATEAAARWDGWGTALKPASEPIVVARKPLAGTVAANVLTYGTGALNIAACRVEGGPIGSTTAGTRRSGGIMGASQPLGGWEPTHTGRWPSNVVLTHAQAEDGGDACAGGCVPGCPVADLDAQSGAVGGGFGVRGRGGSTYANGAGFANTLAETGQTVGYGDEGGASRFFPTFRYQAKADTAQRPRAGQVAHPTVKPLDLMRWLVRLVTPPGGTGLDLFAGSGTTGEAWLLEGMRAVLVEREADYLPLIADRLTRRTDPAAHLTAKAARGDDVDLGLFAGLEGWGTS